MPTRCSSGPATAVETSREMDYCITRPQESTAAMSVHVTGRVTTGVTGLDQLLNGGLPIGRMHLVEGVPGTGKTTLALQFLLEAKRRGEPTLYVTLSEGA